MSNQIYVSEAPDGTLKVDVSNILTVVSKQDIIDALGFYPEDRGNKVSAWSDTTTNIHYPSEKLVKDYVDALRAYVDLKWVQFATIIDPQIGDTLVYEPGGTYTNFKNVPIVQITDGGTF